MTTEKERESYKATLEDTLKTALSQRGCVLYKAALCDDGKTVRLDEDGKVTYRKLTEFGREFLKSNGGGAVQPNEPTWEQAFMNRVLEPEAV